MLSPLPIFGLCLSVFFPLLIQAQSVSDADDRPVTTIRSTITVVPVAYTETTYTTETPAAEESAVIIIAPAPAEESAVIIIAPAPYEGNDTTIAPSGTGAADDNVGTITVTVTGSSSTSPTPTPAVCNAGQVTCPACDGEIVSVEAMSFYTVECDASLSSDAVVDQPAYITPDQCLVTCESTPDCVGTTQSSNGTCSLVVGTTYKLESSTAGDVAFVRVPYISMGTSNSTNTSVSNPIESKFFSSASFTLKPYPTAYPNISAGPPIPLPSPINVTYPNATAYPTAYLSSYPTASGAPILNLPKPIYTNFTLPNATYPTNTSLPIGTGTSVPMSTSVPSNTTLPTNGTCSISNPTCPACDNKTLVDNHNVTYTVFCGYSLDATLDFAFGEPIPAAYCMSRCDERNTTCFGASWSTEECVLALGDFVGMVRDPDHMAFVRAALPQEQEPPYSNSTSTPSAPLPPLSTGLSWQNMSRYPDASSAPAARPTLIATGGQTFTTSVLLPTGPAVQPVPSSRYPSSTRALPSYGSVVKPSSAPTAKTSAAPTSTSSPGEPTDAPWTGGRPPWADGGGGYGGPGGEGHHGPPSGGSWWKGGRPPWAHWGGWGKPSWGHDEEDEGQGGPPQ
jgi:hypothetical protein